MVLDLNSSMEAQEGCDSTNGIKMVRMYKLGCYKGNACLLHTQPGLDHYHCPPAPHLFFAPASTSSCRSLVQQPASPHQNTTRHPPVSLA